MEGGSVSKKNSAEPEGGLFERLKNQPTSSSEKEEDAATERPTGKRPVRRAGEESLRNRRAKILT